MDVTPAIRTAPRDFYRAYLNSPAWRTRRNRALKDARWTCQRCPSKRELEVHHKCYDRLGAEWDEDLEVVCSGCHRSEHIQHPEQTSLGVYLKIASETVGREPFASIADLSEAMKVRCRQLRVPMEPERIKSALAVVCGNRLKTEPPQTVQAVHAEMHREISHDEAKDFINRLGLESLGKRMPAAKASRIDIYGAIPRDDYDHDRY